ncbi:MAG: tRNA (adenosine(37)-N6)-threonylcarbamoyltransferase complex ATPase subunit type 1 TsaE [Candidatus Latescibacterota bacterium]
MDRSEIVRIHTTSPSQTEAFARELGANIDSALCISLVGALGVGKTVFARGLCRGLGIAETIVSPTFILYEEFLGRLPVVHLDLYRLKHEREIEELGVFDKLREDCVIITEWGDRSETILAASDAVVSLRLHARCERDVELNCTRQVRELLHNI